MKLAKSLLLGSAAGFLAVSGASAADLPSRKAAPAEYVRVCSAYGAGFFFIPGTDVCLKVGGFARYQMQYAQPFGSQWRGVGFGTRAQARVELDSRTATAYGTLRAFVRVDFAFRTGSERSGSAARTAYAFDAAGDGTLTGWGTYAQQQVILDKAFVQFGGLVAGRTNSLFEFNKSPELIGTLATSGLFPGTNLLGYIATFGSGFYASVSLEDAVMRRQSVVSFSDPVLATVGGPQYGYAGFRMPDIVAAIGVEQSWGGAQLSAAVHQIPISTYATGANLNNAAGVNIGNATAGPELAISSKYGWAISGGLQINLPMIAPGDYLWLTATYADGAMSYVHSGWFAQALFGTGIGNSFTYYQADAYVNNATGAVQKSKTWSVAGAFQHYWAPTLRSAVFGSYSQFRNPGQIADWNYYNVGVNLIWSPVRALDIGIEGAYQHIAGRGLGAGPVIAGVGIGGGAQTGLTAAQAVAGNSIIAGSCPAVNCTAKTSDGAFVVRFRVQRSF